MINMNISIIDYIGEMNGGIGLLLSLVIKDDAYELSYWYNRDGLVRMVADDNLLTKLKVKNIYEYQHIQSLLDYIYLSLPEPEKILEEFTS